MGLVPGDLVEVDWNLAALTPRCDVAVRLHRASSCAIERPVSHAAGAIFLDSPSAAVRRLTCVASRESNRQIETYITATPV